MTPIPIPAQRVPELRRAADHLIARAEVAEREALGGSEAERRAHLARAFELRSIAAIKRSQADAVERHEVRA